MNKWSRFFEKRRKCCCRFREKKSIPQTLMNWWLVGAFGCWMLPKILLDLLSKTSKICLFGGEEKTPKYIPQMMGSKMVVNYHSKSKKNHRINDKHKKKKMSSFWSSLDFQKRSCFDFSLILYLFLPALAWFTGSMGPFDPHNPSKLSMTSYAQFNNHPMNLLVHHHCAWKLPKKWLLFPSWMEKNKTYHPYHHEIGAHTEGIKTDSHPDSPRL